ncbi:MAG: lysophospholipid acyltransferase family protein, partial [Pseudomonadota bacterium]
ILKRVAPSAARTFPHWYHKRVCGLMGIRIKIAGKIDRRQPTLYVSNHVSWLDIVVLSAVAPVSFVAKKEVSTWPGVSWLANLQRTVFVDRERRQQIGRTAGEISERLAAGDSIVLFAEGTSSDGNRVLPFRSSLFASALPKPKTQPDEALARSRPGASGPEVRQPIVRCIALTYTRLHGVALSRSQRSHIGWYGDMEMVDHAWALLKSGPIDAVVAVGDAIPLGSETNRKTLARDTEALIRRDVTAMLRTSGEE